MPIEYDGLGRRVKKHVAYKENYRTPKVTHFWWNRMQMCAEIEDKEKRSSLYIYNGFSYEPLARIDRWQGDPTTDQLNYYHNHINGCPEEMSNTDGKLIWRCKLNLWGKTLDDWAINDEQVEQNLRFQGQYFDSETGFHYNTFRYYDPEIGKSNAIQ